MTALKKFALPEQIETRIFEIRGQKVMLDMDLAELYGVPTKRLNEQVKRNPERFPAHFMFQITTQELINWKSQFATSNSSVKMGLRKRPYAFTELGVAMLSSVLSSKQAIQVNITIMETFVRLRRLVQTPKWVERELDMITNVLESHDEKIKALFMLVDELTAPGPELKKRSIGFGRDLDESI